MSVPRKAVRAWRAWGRLYAENAGNSEGADRRYRRRSHGNFGLSSTKYSQVCQLPGGLFAGGGHGD